MKMKRNILLLSSLLFSCGLFAQELNCKVQVISNKISGVDQAVFQQLQQSIINFMNGRAWTQDNFAPEERIECSLYIILDNNPSQDYYTGSVTVQSSRPVFNSSYFSPLINFKDANFNFTYTQNTPLEFNLNQFTSNLSSILAYYAYFFLTLDYESMGKGGGAKYLANMNTILTQAPTTGNDSKGWSAFDANPVTGNRNRYQIVSSMQNARYDVFLNAYSEYHFQGLDNMYSKPIEARQTILNTLNDLAKTFKDNPNNVLITLFMQAKSEELISIFSGGEQAEKIKAITLLKQIDPSNAPKYDRIIKG